MKNKILFLIFSLLFNFQGESQQTTLKFIGNENKFSLNGIGDIQGFKGDNAKLAYWTINNTTNFETKAYLKFLKSGKAGIIIREANATNNLQGGRPCYYLYIDASNSKITLANRNLPNTALNILNTITATKKENIWFSLKKENNKLTVRYSYDEENVQNVTWITVASIDNAFVGYNDFVRGVVVASGSKTISNSAIFSNWKELSTPSTNQICGIYNNTLLATKNGTKAYARIYNNKLWVCNVIDENGDKFLVRGVNWIDNSAIKSYTGSYSCFEGQFTDFWGNVEPVGFNIPVGYKLTVQPDGAKIYSIGTNTIVDPPTLTSSPFTVIEGTSVSFNVTNCSNGTNNIYRNNNVVSNSSFLSVSNPTFGDVYKAKCVVNGIESSFSNEIVVTSLITDGGGGSGTVNTLVDIVIPELTKWNFFDPDVIPNSITAKSYHAKYNATLPNKWFIYHAPYRNLFGLNNSEASRLTKMLNKGITAWNISKLPTYTTDVGNIVTPDKIVGESYGLGENGGNPHPEETSYANFANYTRSGIIDVGSYGVVPVNGKYQHLATITDYENLHTNLTTQTASNFHTVGLGSMNEITSGAVGFQYGLGINTGGYYISNLYNGSNNVWALPSDNSVPSQFIGKSSASYNRVIGVNEITYAYETFLPENYVVQDQNNNNWFNIKHFGAELANDYNGGNLDNCNAQHWATNVGVGTETAYKVHKTYNQDLIIQLKPVGETDNGYHYDQRFAQFRGNKYANYVNRFGILNNFGGVEQLQALGSEYLPPFIAEGQILLAYFSGAKGINWWSSDFTDVAIPKDKAGNPQRGAKYNDPNYGNRDLSPYSYTLKALWRLNQKVDLGNGQSYSFNEICDGNEIYLNENTAVVYTNSPNTVKLRALDWQKLKRSCVRAVVNTVKNVVFILAFQAYGVEDPSVVFKLNEYGANISQVINLPVGKLIIKAYPLTGGVSQGGTLNTLFITSNPVNPVAGNNVSFTTSTPCSGTIKWYNGDAQVSTGVNYNVVNSVANTVYSAVCSIGGASSLSSNLIIIGVNNIPSNVTVIEPSILLSEPYYFTNGHTKSYYIDDNGSFTNNLPVIYRSNTKNNSNYNSPTPRPVHPNIRMESGYSMVNDLVWLTNNKVKFGFNLLRGGQLAWASTLTATTNLVYNGYDGGFQVTLDAYQKKDGYSQNGKFSRKQHSDIYQFNNIPSPPSGQPNPNIIPELTSYNTTQGGDFNNNSQSLVYHYRSGNSYIIGVRPIFYTIDSEFSQVIIETKYTLEPNEISLRIEHKYISKRIDTDFNGGGFDGAAVPACFLVNTLNKYRVHNGDNLIFGDLPIENYGQPTLGIHTNKKYLCVHNNDNSKALGVYRVKNSTSAYCKLKQLEVNGLTGTEFTGGFTYVDFDEEFANPVTGIPNRNGFERTMISYIMVGNNSNEIDTEANRLKLVTNN